MKPKKSLWAKMEPWLLSLLMLLMLINCEWLLQELNVAFKILGFIIPLLLLAFYFYCKKKEHYKLQKIAIAAIFCLTAMNGLVYGIGHLTRFLALHDALELEEILLEYENNAKGIFFLICFLQPILLPLPEPLTVMAGSAVFGPASGACLAFFGTTLGIMTMYFFGRFASGKALEHLNEKKGMEKFRHYTKNHEIPVLFALFILPILPDEIIALGGGLLQIRLGRFLTVTVLAKLITSLSLSYSLTFFDMDLREALLWLVGVLFAIWAGQKIYEFVKKRKKGNYSGKS